MASKVALVTTMPDPPVSPVMVMPLKPVTVKVPAVSLRSMPVPVEVTVTFVIATVAVPVLAWLMSIPSAVAPVTVTPLIVTATFAASADVMSIAFELAAVVASVRPRISTLVRLPFAVLASTPTAFPVVAVIIRIDPRARRGRPARGCRSAPD